MLRELRILNLAILPEMTLEFLKGFNVLTGETGAGKSILVAAVGLLAGSRASSDDVRSGEDQALIQGVLEFPEKSPIFSFLASKGIPTEGQEVRIRRQVRKDGGSRVWVNEWSWTVSGLAELSEFWIDINGQHGQKKLLQEDEHLGLLDAYAQPEAEFENYIESYEKVAGLERQLRELRSETAEVLQKKEYLEFQLRELVGAQLKAGEEEELLSLHRRVANIEKLTLLLQNIEELTDGDDGALSKLEQAHALAEKVVEVDSTLDTISQKISAGLEELRELFRDFVASSSLEESEDANIEELNGRLSLLQSIKRKYQSIENAIEVREESQRQLDQLEYSDEKEKEFEKEISDEKKGLVDKAKALTEQRKKAAKSFQKKITAELKLLGMPDARLMVETDPLEREKGAVRVGEKSFGAKGGDRVRLEFAPNLGEGAKSLAKIASGGELSRVLLAIKGVALNETRNQDMAYLFDEVDAGIGGDVAERVGIRLRDLSRDRQVLTVTHLAQVACYGDSHFKVEKKVDEGRTKGIVSVLDAEERSDELARMIGGIKVTRKTLDHAGELLQRAQGAK